MGVVSETRPKSATKPLRGGPNGRGVTSAISRTSFQAEHILERGGIGEEGEVLYLIKWTTLTKAQATWVPRSNIPRDLLDEFEGRRPLAPALAEAEAMAGRRAKKSSTSAAEGATDGEADSAGEGEFVEEHEPQGHGGAGLEQGQEQGTGAGQEQGAGAGQEQGQGADQEQGQGKGQEQGAGKGHGHGAGANEGGAPAEQIGGRDGEAGDDSGEDGESPESQDEDPCNEGNAEGGDESEGSSEDSGGEQSDTTRTRTPTVAKVGSGAAEDAFAGLDDEADDVKGIAAVTLKASVTTGSWTGREWFQVLLLGVDNKETPVIVRKRKQGTSYRYTQHHFLPRGVEASAVTSTGFTLGCDKCNWDPVGYHNRGGRCACTGCSGCRHMLLGCERCRHRLGPRRPRTRQRRSKLSKGLAGPGEHSTLSDYPAMATLPRAATEDQVWARPKGGNVDRHINRGRMERAAAKTVAKQTADMSSHNHEVLSGYRNSMQRQQAAAHTANLGMPPYGHPYGHPGRMVEPPYHHMQSQMSPHGPPHSAYGYGPGPGRHVNAPHSMEMSQLPPHARLMHGDPRMQYPGPHPGSFPSSVSDMHFVEHGPTATQMAQREHKESLGADAERRIKEEAGAGADANAAGGKAGAAVKAAGVSNLLANLAQAASQVDACAEADRMAVYYHGGADWGPERYMRFDPRQGPMQPGARPVGSLSPKWGVEGSCWDSQAPDAMYTTSYWMCGGGAVPPPVWSPDQEGRPPPRGHRTKEMNKMGEGEGGKDLCKSMGEGAGVGGEPHSTAEQMDRLHALSNGGAQRKRMREESQQGGHGPNKFDERQGYMGYEHPSKSGRYDAYGEIGMAGYDAPPGRHRPDPHHSDMTPMDGAGYAQGSPPYYAQGPGPHGNGRLYHPGYPNPGQSGEMHPPNGLRHYQDYAQMTARGPHGYSGYPPSLPDYAPGPGYPPAQYSQPPPTSGISFR